MHGQYNGSQQVICSSAENMAAEDSSFGVHKQFDESLGLAFGNSTLILAEWDAESMIFYIVLLQLLVTRLQSPFRCTRLTSAFVSRRIRSSVSSLQSISAGSRSSVSRMFGLRSRTVTSTPKRWNNWANSIPIAPPPAIAIRRGRVGSDTAWTLVI